MDKLFLALKNTISYHVLNNNIPKLEFKWEKDSIGIKLDNLIVTPMVLFKVNEIRYELNDDKYQVGEMEVSLKIFFVGDVNNPQTERQALEGFKLVKQLECIVKTVDSDETGLLSTLKLEMLNCNENYNCIQYIFSAPYYPIVKNSFN